MKKKKALIGVIGAGKCSKKIFTLAEEVGKEIARAGAILVCGGLGGVMEGASKGAKEAKGITVGVLPGESKEDANPYVDIPIVTGMGDARNLVVILSSDVVIALPGKYGTLSELGFAVKLEKPIVGISTWDISEKIIKTKNPEDAVKTALDLVEKKTME